MNALINSVAFATALLASSAGAEERVQLDSNSANITEASYTFNCGGIRSSLRFEERVNGDDESIPLADRWRIVLSFFAVDSRDIAPADRHRIEQVFGRYAWLTRLRGRCSRANGDLSLWIEGMHADAWAEFVQSDDRPRPGTRSAEIVVAADGAVTIR